MKTERKPRAPLSPAKRAGKITEYTMERDQAMKDTVLHWMEAPKTAPVPVTLDHLKLLESIHAKAGHSLTQAHRAQMKLDKLEA